jgi:hypothetical protein
LQKTTNNAEAWHRRMKAIVVTKRGNVNKLIVFLMREAEVVQNTLANYESGQSCRPLAKKYRDQNDQIRRVLEQKTDFVDTFAFLKNIAKNL